MVQPLQQPQTAETLAQPESLPNGHMQSHAPDTLTPLPEPAGHDNPAEGSYIYVNGEQVMLIDQGEELDQPALCLVRGRVWPLDLLDAGIYPPPTEEELPDSDGKPMDNERQYLQISLLTLPLRRYWRAYDDRYVGANMMVYYHERQAIQKDFIGPDVFIALAVSKRERKSWVMWQEGKGIDVAIEVISKATRTYDKNRKKAIYQNNVRVPYYIWYDPFTTELTGFVLRDGVYVDIQLDEAGRLPVATIGLVLIRWHGVYGDVATTWARWATPDGVLLPLDEEIEAEERKRAEREQERAEREQERAEREQERAVAAEAQLAAERQRIAALEARLAELERDGQDG